MIKMEEGREIEQIEICTRDGEIGVNEGVQSY